MDALILDMAMDSDSAECLAARAEHRQSARSLAFASAAFAMQRWSDESTLLWSVFVIGAVVVFGSWLCLCSRWCAQCTECRRRRKGAAEAEAKLEAQQKAATAQMSTEYRRSDVEEDEDVETAALAEHFGNSYGSY